MSNPYKSPETTRPASFRPTGRGRNLHPFVFRFYPIVNLVYYHVILIAISTLLVARPGLGAWNWVKPAAFLFAIIEALFLSQLFRINRSWLFMLAIFVRLATHSWIPFTDPHAELPLSFKVFDWSGGVCMALAIALLPSVKPKRSAFRVFAAFSIFSTLVSIASFIALSTHHSVRLTLLHAYVTLALGLIESIFRIVVFWNFRDTDLLLRAEVKPGDSESGNDAEQRLG